MNQVTNNGGSKEESEKLPATVFIWNNFGPYHIDRLCAVEKILRGSRLVVGIELAETISTYAWRPNRDAPVDFKWVTLFSGPSFAAAPFPVRLWRMLKSFRGLNAREIFLCHYQYPEIFLLALILRVSGHKVFALQASKFDDRPRYLLRELGKWLLYLPYNGAIGGSRRTVEYLRFLGFHHRKVVEGYDTIDIARIKELAGTPAAPDGVPFKDRHFTVVARLVEKKNISLAISAYALYRELAGDSARPLVIVGSGHLEDKLRAEADQTEDIHFKGFLQSDGVAKVLASSLALLLPSIEEQFGLVVNESLALGVPVLCSDNAGARDSLIRTSVNGYIFEPDNAKGLAHLMLHLCTEESEWRRLAEACHEFSAIGDVSCFAEATLELIDDKSVEAI